MAADAAPDTGALDTTAAAEPQAPVDLAPLTERFDGLEGMVRSLADRIPTPEPEPSDPFAGLEFDGLVDPGTGDMDPQEALRLLDQIADRRSSQAVQDAVTPLMERIEAMQTNLDADALVQRYPQLADPAVHQPIVARARDMASRLFPQDPQAAARLAGNPQFFEAMFKADMAEKYAAGEVPAGSERQFELENAGGGAPSASEPNVAAGIVNARPRNAFWGV